MVNESFFQVLFSSRGSDSHLLKELEVETHRARSIETGLVAFNKLIMNKHFLLTAVRTMEENIYFHTKERVYVGSLLMVILLVSYFSLSELFEIITDLIEKSRLLSFICFNN